ncbi:MAG: hypothetical protein KGQ75_01205 [Sphingomonadales bacterium]|nr:hypothetical protein [Sphingomonadales bacterium]
MAAAGLVLLAVAAVLSGSDRQSREFPNAPSVVGWPYDTGAARAKAAIALLRSGPASATGYARRSILSDPISAQAVSLLGRSELLSHRMLDAHRAFQVSGQLGWRDSITQVYWLDQALQSQDYRVAAERLDALLRQSPDREERDRFLAAVAATPEGRDALARRLRLAPAWAATMITDVRGLPADQLLLRSDLMRRTGPRVWDCQTSERLSQQLIAMNLLQDAQSVWRLNCQSTTSLVYDGRFDDLDVLKPATAFNWQLSNRGDADIALLDNATGNRHLRLRSNATVTLPILRQLVVLGRGSYRLTWRTPNTTNKEANSLRVSMTCRPDLSGSVTGKLVDTKQQTWSADFIVDGECTAQQLVFWLLPRNSIELDDVMLISTEK